MERTTKITLAEIAAAVAAISEPLDTIPPTIPTYWSKTLGQFVTIPE